MHDHKTTFSAGCDGTVRMWDVTQGPNAVQQIGKHDQPVRCMKWMPELNLLATGSWDKSIRFWDCRQPTPAQTFQLSERVYAMDTRGKILVCGTADKQLSVWPDVTLGANQKIEYKTPLNDFQTRCISIFHDHSGFAVGSIEGRVGIEYFDEVEQKSKKGGVKLPNAKSFVFKCHRDKQDIFGVNCLDFYSKHNDKFLTGGGDGSLYWWDKKARNRLAIKDKFKTNATIVDAKFSPNGSSMFYVCSYDWSKGAEHKNKYPLNQIYHHAVLEKDMTSKKK